MNRASVNSESIREVDPAATPGAAAKIFSSFFSYLFHPVFIPLYVALFLLYIHPSAFAGFSSVQKKQTLLIIVLNLVFFPLVTVLLLKALDFIGSLYLRTQKDRIIPYIASGIFFFWAYTVFKQQTAYPLLLTIYILGIFLAASLALIANIYFKISMHAIGLGGWLGFFLIIAASDTMLMTWPLCAVLLITGCVCSSRLVNFSHAGKDIYLGLFTGAVTQYVAAVILL